jgi:hypothetical protein
MTTLTLRTLTDDELLALYLAAADDAGRELALAEGARRDRLDRARRVSEAQRAEWHDAAHAQYLAADAECRGNLVDARHAPAWVDGWSLWQGPADRAYRYATEELRNFWDRWPRVTVTEWRQQIADGRRIQRDELDAAGRHAGPRVLTGATAYRARHALAA